MQIMGLKLLEQLDHVVIRHILLGHLELQVSFKEMQSEKVI